VPQVRTRVSSGARQLGGVLGYPLESLYGEVAFVAYHFHWQPDAILNLEHGERRRWVKEISAINQRINNEESRGGADRIKEDERHFR
jgi:hypothetical protein